MNYTDYIVWIYFAFFVVGEIRLHGFMCPIGLEDSCFMGLMLHGVGGQCNTLISNFDQWLVIFCTLLIYHCCACSGDNHITNSWYSIENARWKVCTVSEFSVLPLVVPQ